MYQSEEINELMKSLAIAQGEMQGALKDSSNPFFKSKYADLNSVWNACRAPLSKNNLAIVQTMQHIEGETYLVTTLGHASGQWMKSFLPMKSSPKEKTNELQALGSCITYLRRYALSAIVGVCPDDDDDGNSGGNTYRNFESKKADVTPIVQKEPIISADRARMLAEEFEQVPEFKNQVLASLSISKIEDLPERLYDRIKGSLTKKIREKAYSMDNEFINAGGA